MTEKRGLRAVLTLVFVIYMCVFLFTSPEYAKEEVYYSLLLCLRTVVPTLFPFFVLTSLIVSSGMTSYAGKGFAWAAYRLFGMNAGEAYALLLGCVGGFPLGTKAVCELYSAGGTEKKNAETLAALTNLCSPFFILGASRALFGETGVGVCVYCANITVTLVFLRATSGKRKKRAGAAGTENGSGAARDRGSAQDKNSRRDRGARRETQEPRDAAGKEAEKAESGAEFSFAGAITSSFTSLLSLCGIIAFFSCVASSVTRYTDLYCFDDRLSVFIGGFLEMTRGVFSLNDIADPGAKAAIFAFFVSFGGVSVIAQSSELCRKAGLSSRAFWVIKPIFAVLSTGVSYIFILFFR